MIVLILQLTLPDFDPSITCLRHLWIYLLGYILLLISCTILEVILIVISFRGSVFKGDARNSLGIFLYLRLFIMLGEIVYNTLGTVWLLTESVDCPMSGPKYTIAASIGYFWLTMLMFGIMVCCTYDAAGKKWVRMKKYQRSIEESELVYKRSSGNHRNWRQRMVYRTQNKTWSMRCNYMLCCVPHNEHSTKSFAEVARIFSDFFRDLDLVPSDIIAGLVLLNKYQRSEKKSIVYQQKNGVYDYMSGVPIGPTTKFMNLKDSNDLSIFKAVCRFTQHALWAYGWMMYPTIRHCGLCKLCCSMRCCSGENSNVQEGNSCGLIQATLNRITEIGDIKVIYANYHVGVGQTPFFIALDHDYKKVVVSIRGTLSVQDILTDLNGDMEMIPGMGPDYQAHKGMVTAATYVFDVIKEKNLLQKALSYTDKIHTAANYQVVLTGHSLGGGAAAILGMMMKQKDPDLTVYSISPPGGLFSTTAMEHSKKFMYSLVVGKDAVPRLGLHQLETLRADLISVLQDTDDPKWKIISNVMCCGGGCDRKVYVPSDDDAMTNFQVLKDHGRKHGVTLTPTLSQSTPMYPPGRIIHIVKVKLNKLDDPDIIKTGGIYQALWADNKEFNEVLISPFDMINDHMPHKILGALRKVIENQAPKKPPRSMSKYIPSSDWEKFGFEPTSPISQHRVCLETSFTSLQSPTTPITVAPSSIGSSATNGYFSTRSEASPVPITNIMNFLNNKTKSQQDIQVHAYNTGNIKTRNALRRTASEIVDSSRGKVDLIHDDWFGLAPLASPESLSEVSSISSRTSATNLDRIQTLGGSYELKTPKVMRRTPKINNNLSTCADDVKNVRYYQKLGQISKHLRRPSQNGGSLTNSSSNLSFESAPSFKCTDGDDVSVNRCCNIAEELQPNELVGLGNVEVIVEDRPNTSGESDDFQSVEDILNSVMKSAGCADYFNSKTDFLETHFDESMFVDEKPPPYEAWPQLASPCTPVNDPDILSNFAIDLNLSEEYRSLHYSQIAAENSKSNSIDSGSICRTPSDTKNVTFNPQVYNIEENVASPVSSPRKRKWNFMPTKHKNVKNREPSSATSAAIVCKPEILPKTILCSNSKRRNSSEDFFSRPLEALPLLSSNSERTSPNFVRRKKYVYPAVTMISKGESSV